MRREGGCPKLPKSLLWGVERPTRPTPPESGVALFSARNCYIANLLLLLHTLYENFNPHGPTFLKSFLWVRKPRAPPGRSWPFSARNSYIENVLFYLRTFCANFSPKGRNFQRSLIRDCNTPAPTPVVGADNFFGRNSYIANLFLYYANSVKISAQTEQNCWSSTI